MLNAIYIPGLGDKTAYGQELIIQTWLIYGVKGHCERMLWADGRPFAPKLQRLLDRIDALHQEGKQVALVASSAGATAALAAFAQRQDVVKGVVCICGKINDTTNVSPATFAENVSFRQSLYQLQDILPTLSIDARKKIMSIHPITDNVVPIENTIISGAEEVIIPTHGHSKSIAYGLIIAAHRWTAFLRSL
jgi:pimeloyl-ACP methyl ester carboxylesterase